VTIAEQQVTQREANVAIGGYCVGLAVLIASFAVSYLDFLETNNTNVLALILLLAGAGVAFISSFFVWTTDIGQTTRFVSGALTAGGGALGLATWPFALTAFVLPSGEELRSACWYPLIDAGAHGGVGKTLDISTTLLPTQIHCSMGTGPSAVVLSGLESTALSAVVIALMLLAIGGIYLMLTRGKRSNTGTR
jgi:hypothetical protein